MAAARGMVIVVLLFASVCGCASLMEVMSPASIDDIAGVWEGYYSDLGAGYCRMDIRADGSGCIVSISDDREDVYEIESIVFVGRYFILKPVYPDDLRDKEKYIIKGQLAFGTLFLAVFDGGTMKDPQTGSEKKPILTMSFMRDVDLDTYRRRAAEIMAAMKREHADQTGSPQFQDAD